MMFTKEELQAIREVHRQGYRCTFTEEQRLLNEVEQLRNALTTIRNIKSRDHNDPVKRLQHIDNIACQALGGDFHTDIYVDEENQRLRDDNDVLREAVISMFDYTSICPFCREYGYTGKHNQDCALNRALQPREEKRPKRRDVREVAGAWSHLDVDAIREELKGNRE
jgi:hypothetical protein